MKSHTKHIVCPLAMAGMLDGKLRRFLHDPNKILKKFITKNMTILDIGCGPGVFSIEAAKLMEGTGKVVAVDMQEGMLEILRNKIKGEPFEKNIVLHKCTQESINIKEKADLVLMIYMVHEVPNKENLFNEITPLINKNGLLLIVEHNFVPKREFNKMVYTIIEKGFTEHSQLKVAFSRGIVLRKC